MQTACLGAGGPKHRSDAHQIEQVVRPGEACSTSQLETELTLLTVWCLSRPGLADPERPRRTRPKLSQLLRTHFSLALRVGKGRWASLGKAAPPRRGCDSVSFSQFRSSRCELARMFSSVEEFWRLLEICNENLSPGFLSSLLALNLTSWRPK